jgi:DNA-binding Lrp family transcriptional regulator
MAPSAEAIDAVDARVINALQGGFPLTERPYRDAAAAIGLTEEALIARLDRLLRTGVLSRFGPLWQVERLGGAYLLAAMQVPEARFDEVAQVLAAFAEVAHNYRREHAFNMWFVLAADSAPAVADAAARIESATGLAVLQLPKEREYYVGLNLVAQAASDGG